VVVVRRGGFLSVYFMTERVPVSGKFWKLVLRKLELSKHLIGRV
jgi:hypothetical protein